MKNYLLMATAIMAMASCANDTDLSVGNSETLGNGAIAFNMNTPATTRDVGATTSTTQKTGKSAAEALGSEFIVWGEKNEGSDNNAGITNLTGNSNVVFENYRVQYTASTANTTESNTKNWEYVGITPYNGDGTAPGENSDGDESTAKVSPSVYKTEDGNVKKQTIKYWDFGKQYTFTAVSALQSDIKKQLVKIEKNYSESTAATKGYTIELGEGANADKVYVADRQTKTVNSKSADGAAADAVTLNFRNFMSKIRFGIYETVPGYKVVITGIKYTKAEGESTETTHTNSKSSTDKKFGIDGQFITVGAKTKYKVTYVASGANQNKAQVELVTKDGETTITPASAAYKETEGTTWLSTSATNPVSNVVTAPTYDNYNSTSKEGDYTTIMPNPSNETNMKLQISFKLISEDTGEVIEFKNGTDEVFFRTVEVPAAYCQWKSNYAYTYLFKITDKSAELYPITFDAVVVEDENGTQETITEVSDPSITTMGVKDNKVVTGKNEYEVGSDIYASVVEKNSNNVYETVTLTSSNIALYTVTSTTQGGAVQEITEASVANCIANGKEGTNTDGSSNGVKTVTDLNGCVMTATPVTIGTDGTTAPCIVSEVPTEEGLTNATRNLSALKWNGTTASTVYAIQYKGTGGKLYYKIVKIAAQ